MKLNIYIQPFTFSPVIFKPTFHNKAAKKRLLNRLLPTGWNKISHIDKFFRKIGLDWTNTNKCKNSINYKLCLSMIPRLVDSSIFYKLGVGQFEL